MKSGVVSRDANRDPGCMAARRGANLKQELRGLTVMLEILECHDQRVGAGFDGGDKGIYPPHPNDRSTALCHPAANATRRVSSIPGSQLRATAQFRRRSARSRQYPTARPAA